jgi:hypothetical protein
MAVYVFGVSSIRAVGSEMTTARLALFFLVLIANLHAQAIIDFRKFGYKENNSLDRSAILFLTDDLIAVHLRTDPPLVYEPIPGGTRAAMPPADPGEVLIYDTVSNNVVRQKLLAADGRGTDVFFPGPNQTFFLREENRLVQYNATFDPIWVVPAKPGRYGSNVQISPNREYISVPIAPEQDQGSGSELAIFRISIRELIWDHAPTNMRLGNGYLYPTGKTCAFRLRRDNQSRGCGSSSPVWKWTHRFQSAF